MTACGMINFWGPSQRVATSLVWLSIKVNWWQLNVPTTIRIILPVDHMIIKLWTLGGARKIQSGGLVRQSIRPQWCLSPPNPHPSSLSLLPNSHLVNTLCLEDIHKLFNEPWTQIVISKTMVYCKIIRRHRKYVLEKCIKFWRQKY